MWRKENRREIDAERPVPFFKRRWFGWTIQIALVVIVYLGMQFYQTQNTPKGMMPAFSASFLDGRTGNFPADLKEPTLVHFWATWCTVCRLEQGSINSISESHNVVAIASQSGSVFDVRKTVDERGIGVPVIVDESGQLARRFGIRAFPTSFVVDENGMIRYTEVGFTTELGLRFRLWLAGL